MQRWFAWNILFRAHEMLKGHDTFRMLREMEAADRLSRSGLEQLQRERLCQLMNYCYTHVPYTRTSMDQAGITPSQIAQPSDLLLLPLMNKATIRANREQLRSRVAGVLTPFATGGSTGEPLIFDLAKRRIASRVACRLRASRWWGVSVGDPEIAIWGSPVELTRQDRVRAIRDWLLSSRLLPAFEMTDAAMSRYLDVLERSGCKQVFGYPSALHLLCLHAQKRGRNLRNLGVKVAFVTGEVLYDHQRRVIRETLNCPVANGYGGRDSGFISHECPDGGMHIMADALILEIIGPDGKPLPHGQSGEIVVTDLYSHEAPFIRYATGDIGVLSDRRCSCGRVLPLLNRIEGRSNDAVIAPDGRSINSLAVIYALREIEGIDRYRIHQKALDRFHVQIVRAAAFSPDAEDQIRKAWTALMRQPVTVEFEYVTELTVEKSGKFRHVVSDARLDQLASRVPVSDVR